MDTVLVAVEELRDGDLVDLEGDKYADPNHDDVVFQDEYAQVWGEPLKDWDERNERDKSDTTEVRFNWPGAVGFPRGWKVRKLAVDRL